MLDLADLPYSSSEYLVWTQITTGSNAGGTLQIYNGSGVLEETLNLAGTYDQSEFLLASDFASTSGTKVLFTLAPVIDTWTGDGANGEWSNAANWSGGVPVSNSEVEIAAAAVALDTSGSPATIYSLSVSSNATLNVTGGSQSGATAQMVVTGAVPSTLTGSYSIVGDAGGAVLQYGSGGITQIGDGASNSSDLYIDGANAFIEVGATNSNSALDGLATIASNGVLDLRDGASVTTDTSLTINGGSARLKIDAYGGNGGSTVTIGGNLINSSSGSFSDGGVSVGNGGMRVADLLTVDGTFTNTGGLLTLTGGTQSGATAQMVVTGAVPSTLTGSYSIVGDAGGAVLQYGSGGITQIGDGASNSSDLYIDGANAFIEVGATNSNSALDGLATIASNGVLDLRDGASVTTDTSLTINGGSARLKIDAYGGNGGSTVTIGGNLINSSSGSFSDGGVSVGNGGMRVADLLTVDGTFTNTGGLLTLTGGTQSGATAQMVVTGAVPSTLTGSYSIVGDAGGAVLQYGSGGITQIGDGASNSSDLYIDGANAFIEVGATNSNSALDGLATIASNGVLDVRDGASVTTDTSLTINGGSARLKIDAYGGNGGSTVTIGGNLINSSSGSFSDGGVSVGNGGMRVADLLTVDGTFTNTGGLLTLTGGTQSGATAQMVVTGAVPSTLTGSYSIVGDAGGAVLQYGSGGITQIGDGASNSSDLYIDGANAFIEVGATNSNSALDGLATIASNGVLDLRDGASVTTDTSLTINGGSARLKIDAYGGNGGSTVTIGGNLINSSSGSFSDGGVSVGNGGMSVADRLTVDGSFTNSGVVTLNDGSGAAATAQLLVMGAFYNSGTVSGTGTLTVSGVTTVPGGSESGGGTTIAQGGASLFDGASETFTLSDYTLQLQGTSETAAATGDTINLNNGSQLVIENGATFTDQGTNGTAFTIESTSGSGSLTNDGTYLKTGNGQTDIDAVFTNNGALEVDAGVLIVGSNVSGSGTVMITGGGAADFLEAFHQNVMFSGAGALQLARRIDNRWRDV